MSENTNEQLTEEEAKALALEKVKDAASAALTGAVMGAVTGLAKWATENIPAVKSTLAFLSGAAAENAEQLDHEMVAPSPLPATDASGNGGSKKVPVVTSAGTGGDGN